MPVYQKYQTQSTLDFLAAIFEPDDLVEIRQLPSRTQSWHRVDHIGDELPRLLAANQRGQNIYFGANPRPCEGADNNESIALARCIYADFDHCEAGEAIERITAAGLPTSTVIVASGHGAHAYWRLAEPMTDLGAWRELMKEFIALVGSDKSVHDPARIMRLPGTMNHKEPAAPCELLECDHERVYRLDELRRIIPRHRKSEPVRGSGGKSAFDRCMAYLAKCPDSVSGNRGHDAMLRAACECLRFGLADGDALAVLRWFNGQKADPQWTESELAHKLESAKGMVNGDFGCRLKEPKNQRKTLPNEPDDNTEYVTELGNAQELVRRHGDNIRFDTDSGAWMVWEGSAWREDYSGRVARWTKEIARETWRRLEHLDSRLVAKHASRMETAAGLAGVLKLASTEENIPVRRESLDADPFLLNCRNAAIDLRTGEAKPHDRADLCSKVAPVTFDPQAKCQLWLSVLGRIMAGNEGLISYLQRLAGLCLTGDASIHELFVFHGGGANGKSVTIDTLLGLLGPYAGVAPESLLIQKTHSEHPTELADLCGRRLVVGSETEEGGNLRIQLVKRLTGDATIKGRFMRQDFFEFRRTHKLILVTNNRPRISEDSEAVWRRIRLIPFDVTIPPEERDTQLLEKLEAERPGILNWCIAGCLAYQRDGMNPPEEVMAATSAYRADANPLGEFVEQRIRLNPESRATRNDVYAAYQSFCVQAGDKHPMDRATLFERIRRLTGVSDDSWRLGGVVVRGFRGLEVVDFGGVL